MREIEFRGKSIKTGEWVYGSLTLKTSSPRIAFYNKVGYWIEVEVVPESIGQYTGLKDKNSKKVYDGSIIEGHTFDERFNEKQIGEIAYNEDRHGFVFIPIRMKSKNLYYPLFAVITCEVIGNIYDNPELLEVSE